MRKFSTFIIVVLFFVLPSLSFSQSSSSASVWFTLNAPEGSAITASGPITLRFGQLASTCVVVMSSGPCSNVSVGTPSPEAWTSPITFTPPSGSATVSISASAASFDGVDPIPGVYKTVQIQEQQNPQNISVNGQAVTIPGLVSPSDPPSNIWFTLNALEGSIITAPTLITLRYGQLASTCAVVSVSSGPCSGATPGSPTPETWTSPQKFSPPSSSSPVSIAISTSTFNNVDPLPGVYKTVQILETVDPKTITVNGQSVTVPGTSTQTTCELVAKPSSINFQDTTVGYTLSSSGSIVSNCPTAVTVSSVLISGPYSTSGFGTPFSLASGQTQNYTAIFTPTAAGTTNGTITFVSNAATTGKLSVSLTGTGIAPSNQAATLSPSATSLNFGSIALSDAQTQTLTITNSGSTAVTVSSVQAAGTGFSIGALTTPFTLAASRSRQIAVIFTPTVNGSAFGAVTITSNASNSTLRIPLVGAGISSTTAHTVDLSWNGSSSQVSGYNIYRSTVSGGPYSKVNSSTITTTIYTDQTVTGGSTYYYTVTAVSTNGVESAFSNETSVVVPSP